MVCRKARTFEVETMNSACSPCRQAPESFKGVRKRFGETVTGETKNAATLNAKTRAVMFFGWIRTSKNLRLTRARIKPVSSLETALTSSSSSDVVVSCLASPILSEFRSLLEIVEDGKPS
ncbi:hypothetical protein F2Q69_00009833 [Brassica cretica]|uniref:Uncharacterized protein n=1 Tax=Brassica cretica TaxID=69181 RepID=A0A8S9NWX1_BRACR|nr:hypothetical protein F2Q69_00009833 [Brassica cretica]